MRHWKTTEQRFSEKIELIPFHTCWQWVGATCRGKGYGTFYFNGIYQRAHRAAWQMYYGPIPKAMHVLHHCDNPACVNPQHLFLGTNTDNVNDKVNKNRQARHKLTQQQSLEIKALLANCVESKAAIARKYGITRSVVRRMGRGH